MKRNRLFVLAAGLIFAVSLLCCWISLRPSSKDTVEVIQDGTILYSFSLSEMENQSIAITYEGGNNLIAIEDGKICVAEADCPDQTCVRSGWLQSETLPIVCLPNRLVIQFAKGEGPDATVQ